MYVEAAGVTITALLHIDDTKVRGWCRDICAFLVLHIPGHRAKMYEQLVVPIESEKIDILAEEAEGKLISICTIQERVQRASHFPAVSVRSIVWDIIVGYK